MPIKIGNINQDNTTPTPHHLQKKIKETAVGLKILGF